MTGVRLDEDTSPQRIHSLLEAERLRLELIVRHAPVGIALSDAEGNNVLANERMHDILGTRMPPTLGEDRPYIGRYVATGEIIQQGEWPLQRALRGETSRQEMEITRRDGSIVTIACNATPVRDDRGAVVGAIAVLEDLTALRAAQRELEQARREVAHSEKLSALGSLVAGVAHEVRTPLAYITNNVYLLQQRLERAQRRGDVAPATLEELRPALGAALEGVDRIAYLVKELRRFTRVEAPTRERVALRELVAHAVEIFRQTHPGQRLRAGLQDAGLVEADRTQVQQVVLNLLENAVEAMGPGGELAIIVARGASGPEVRVRDHGPGIPPDVQARMFDPFFTTKEEGTGLGLAIVRRIVEQHGGSIRWETGAEGTTFVVSLPNA